MPYFQKFEKLYYDYSQTNKEDLHIVTDLMTRVDMTVGNTRTARLMMDPYIIQDLDKPEAISYTLYGTPFYHWTILYVNNVTNMQTDWPLSPIAFENYMLTKYQTNISAIKHYRSQQGVIGDPDWIYSHFGHDALPVTYYDWELEQNEKKKQILVVKPQYIANWVSDFMSKI